MLFRLFVFLFHGQADAVFLDIDFLNRNFYHLAYPKHLGRVTDITVGDLRNMHEAVLMHADIDERAETTTLRTVPEISIPGLKSSIPMMSLRSMGAGSASRISRPVSSVR